ncbi:MAG: ATP-dependent DNA helicase RecG [Candidatus Xenobia bacterium]
MTLAAPIGRLKGVGESTQQRLARLGIGTLRDLIWHFPSRYEDRRIVRPLNELYDGDVATVVVRVMHVREKRPRPKMSVIEAVVSDGTATASLVWFNQPHMLRVVRGGMKLFAAGKVERKLGFLQLNSPDVEAYSDQPSHAFGRLVPVYPLTEGIFQKQLRRLINEALHQMPALPDVVPPELQNKHGLLPRRRAIIQMHYPKSEETREVARLTLAFEELFVQQLGVRLKRMHRAEDVRQLHYGSLDVERFVSLLPFTPTGAQRRAFQTIADELRDPHPMALLLQGDVGSGKTAVAAFAACCAGWSGYQAAVMAPTEILAEQHAIKFREMLEPAGMRVGLLTGSMRARERREVKEALRDGSIHVLVGTHALIQEGVDFRNLALAVVDEQHKFGVLQRSQLSAKGPATDLLVMTATPIPRTLALTLYGDLDATVLDELPPGRTPIKTTWIRPPRLRDAYAFVRQQVGEGRQAYVVCPLIEQSEKLELASAQELFEELSRDIFPELRLGLLHGRLHASDKQTVMEAFRGGAYDILVSTTVIEVGVDVPNSTVMLIRDADRFGLAQLHQLRGRVGRGAHQSHCILVADPEGRAGQDRMRVLERSNDGFVVAEEDLRQRGPGDFYGTRQAGFMELRVADLVGDASLLDLARAEARALLERDPSLHDEQWLPLRLEVERMFPGSAAHFH